jgi:hypothetical protein
MVNKYVKLAVEIEAMRLTYPPSTELLEWAQGALRNPKRNSDGLVEIEVTTLEDGKDKRVKHIATEGDYIIKGIQGEFYPCKADIFEASYKQVTDNN